MDKIAAGFNVKNRSLVEKVMVVDKQMLIYP